MLIDIPQLEKLARSHRHIVRTFTDAPENLLWGEADGDRVGILPQLELIEKYSIEIVLHKSFDTREYDPSTRRLSFRRDAPRNQQEDYYVTPSIAIFLKAADAYGFKLVGCDLTHQEKEDKLSAKLAGSVMYREFDGMKVKGILCELGVPYDDNSRLQNAIDSERCVEMAKTFSDYARLTEKPVLAIVGRYHVADSSSLHNELNGMSYCVIERR